MTSIVFEWTIEISSIMMNGAALISSTFALESLTFLNFA
jgi:hypothetical protein